MADDPRHAIDAVRHVLRRWAAPPWSDPALSEMWLAAVGPAVARHSRIEELDKDVLRVIADRAVWLQELSLRSDEILSRVNQHLGAGRVRALRVRLGRLAAAPPPARPPAPTPGPVPAEVVAAVEAELSGVDDAELRAAIRDARIAQVRRRARGKLARRR